MIAVVVVQDHQVVIASTGGRDEASGLVGIDLSSGLGNGAKTFECFSGCGIWGGVVITVEGVISIGRDDGDLLGGS